MTTAEQIRARLRDGYTEVGQTLQSEYPDGTPCDADDDDPWCVTCGHHGTDHPRGGQCGAADDERCDCQRYREPAVKSEALKVAT